MPIQPNFDDYEERYRQMLEMQARQMALQWGAQRAGMQLGFSLNTPLTDPYGRLNYLRTIFPRLFMARTEDQTSSIKDLIRGARAETPSIKDLIRIEEGNRWLDLQDYRPDAG